MTKKSDSKREYVFLFLKGAGMGAADVVPGVSGGTVAFITGIYARFLSAIKSVNLEAFNILKSKGFKACWAYIDGAFLLTVFSGLITSAASLAKVITYLLANHQLLVWSFFIGLILASFVYIAKQIKHWHINTVVSCILGVAIAYTITSLSPAQVEPQWWLYFIAGCIAICAMILPGISGSFILLLLGMYGHVLSAITNQEIALIALFLSGCVIGLMLFSRFLSWLLSSYQQITFALLAGFLLGSLNLLWPWKKVVSTYVNSKGVEMPLSQQNITPFEYAEVIGQNPQMWLCIGLAAFGFFFILGIEKLTEHTA